MFNLAIALFNLPLELFNLPLAVFNLPLALFNLPLVLFYLLHHFVLFTTHFVQFTPSFCSDYVLFWLQTIAPADIICSVDRNSRYSNTCSGKAGKGDIYVHVKGNAKPNIFFAINVTFTNNNPVVHVSITLNTFFLNNLLFWTLELLENWKQL